MNDTLRALVDASARLWVGDFVILLKACYWWALYDGARRLIALTSARHALCVMMYCAESAVFATWQQRYDPSHAELLD